uniref:Uncharacterized protein n=1 Tax=Romanomermis culicivorax TaxID=13658 RepID=A0A915K1M3_ROMCU
LRSLSENICTLFADFIFDEDACRPHGFTPALTCDGCQELYRWKLDALKSTCEKCCSTPASQEE